MKAYYVAHLTINDSTRYAEVQKRFPNVFKQYKARVLAADSQFEILDGNISANRVVILEFDSPEELKRWYFSPEYQETVKLRQNAAEANIILVHGQ